MMSRVQLMLAGALAVMAGSAYAAPSDEGVTLANRAQQVAVRMSNLQSYDQATRAVPLPGDQATQVAARTQTAERPEVVTACCGKHQGAMQNGGSRDAG